MKKMELKTEAETAAHKKLNLPHLYSFPKRKKSAAPTFLSRDSFL